LETRSRLRTRVAGDGEVWEDDRSFDALVLDGGMMAMSAALVRRASAHWDGTVKDRSYCL